MSELSDRELDALVAEKVMGEPRPLQVAECDLAPIEGHVTSRLWLHVHIYDHGDKCEVVPREFSTDISAAMEVVEKMRERNFAFSAQTIHLNATAWRATFDDGPLLDPPFVNQSMTEWSAMENSLPRAICLAALSTVGEK